MSYAFRNADFGGREPFTLGLDDVAGRTSAFQQAFSGLGRSTDPSAGLSITVDDLVGSLSADGAAAYLSSCGCASCIKATGNYNPDGLGANPVIKPTPAQLLATAAIADGTNVNDGTAVKLTVDGPRYLDTINTVGDVDFFQIEVVAGQTYNIGMYTKIGGAPPQGSGVALVDAYIELYDATGKMISNADGGGPNTPSGLDALLNFTATETGTLFIRAKSFDQDGTNGTDGDGVGDYEVFVQKSTAAANDPNAYRSFYNIDSPLHALDWGTEWDRTSRNPDGDNGTRSDNGAPTTGSTFDFRTGIEGKNVMYYYLAKQGDIFVEDDPSSPGLTATIIQAQTMPGWEKQAYRNAFDEYEKFADIVYIETQNRNEADFKIISYAGTPGPASLLGRASPPGEENEGQMEFNSGDFRFTENGLTKGGFFFPTLLHEMGHAHGMSHPHDNGGRSSIMRGAGGGTGGIGGAYGDFDLSQGIFTMMSYNDGWDKRPDGTRASPAVPVGTMPDAQVNYGHIASLGALDIAVIQDKYGVNEEYNNGANVYQLKDVNAKGTYYETIWDGGGTDEIRYDGARNGVIDLRAATLKYETGGGGFVSYFQGIQGGFTIANGAVIENARSGSGNDILIGNAADNVLNGGAGADFIDGGAGSDTVSFEGGTRGYIIDLAAQATDDGDTLVSIENVIGSAFDDLVFGSEGDNVMEGGLGADRLNGYGGSDTVSYRSATRSMTIDLAAGAADDGDVFSGVENAIGSAFDDIVFGSEGDNVMEGGLGADRLNGYGGSDTVSYAGYNRGVTIDLAVGAADDGDSFTGVENAIGSAFNDMVFGSEGDNVIRGGAGNDDMRAFGGNDTLIGGAGSDALDGGAGADRFVYEKLSDSTLTASDRIFGFNGAEDRIDLSALDANNSLDGDQAFAFASAFSGVAGEAVLSYSAITRTTTLSLDVNGDSKADFQLIIDGQVGSANGFVL